MRGPQEGPPPLRGPADLARHPNPLAAHYTRFRVAERLLFTGHSHQGWPDVAFEAQQQAWLDAAEQVDDKWERVFAISARIEEGVRALHDDPSGEVTLGQNTLELVARFLSALPLRERPRLVTTDGEFHTIRRLLARLEEEGIEVVRIPSAPVETLAERLAAAADHRTAAVLVSAVLFESARIVPGLGLVREGCGRVGAELLVDAYHATNVVPLSFREEGLEGAFVVGGGYKYLQWGEGCCFLRSPADTRLRPVLTGWFSEFGRLADAPVSGGVRYGAGSARFAGSTFDPTSRYRAAAVLDFFGRMGLSPGLLRELSRLQVTRLADGVREGDPDPAILRVDDPWVPDERGGFLVLRSPRAGELVRRLRERGVLTDARGDALRLGPAPYLSDVQIDDAVGRVLEVARELT